MSRPIAIHTDWINDIVKEFKSYRLESAKVFEFVKPYNYDLYFIEKTQALAESIIRIYALPNNEWKVKLTKLHFTQKGPIELETRPGWKGTYDVNNPAQFAALKTKIRYSIKLVLKV